MAHSHHAHREHQVSHRRVAHILKGEPAGAMQHNHSAAFSKVTSKSAAERHDDYACGGTAPKRYARGGKVKKADGGTAGQVAQDTKGDSIPKKDPSRYGDASGANQGEAKRWQRATDAQSYLDRRLHNDEADSTRPKLPYARGGKVKSKSGHQTNIAIVVPHRGAQEPMAGAPPGGAMPMPAPGGPPPGMPPGAGAPPPGMPPGMPMHKRGGKVIDGEADAKDIKEWSGRAKKNSYFRGGAASGVGREEKAEHQKRK